jgi:amino-acid N-acetyltransferase
MNALRGAGARQFGGAAVRSRGLAVRAVRREAVVVREAGAGDVSAIHELIAAHVAEGHLLPRTPAEIAAHASRFVVATDGNEVVGCADIAPLSDAVGEIRSLVIGEAARGLGIGHRLVNELVRRAGGAGFRTLCAFTSAPGFFVQMGFSIVPHSWLPEKIQADCRACARFRACGQYAVMLPLGQSCQR